MCKVRLIVTYMQQAEYFFNDQWAFVLNKFVYQFYDVESFGKK